MDYLIDAVVCNELMLKDCIEQLQGNPAKAHDFIQALLEGKTVSYHGYTFTDYDTQRIYDAIKITR